MANLQQLLVSMATGEPSASTVVAAGKAEQVNQVSEQGDCLILSSILLYIVCIGCMELIIYVMHAYDSILYVYLCECMYLYMVVDKLYRLITIIFNFTN